MNHLWLPPLRPIRPDRDTCRTDASWQFDSAGLLAGLGDDADVVPAARKSKRDVGVRMVVDCVDGSPGGDVVSLRSDDEHRDMDILQCSRMSIGQEAARRELIVEIEPSEIIRVHSVGQPRDRWLTRSEAAKLIWTCWRYRERQKASRHPEDDVKMPTAKRPLRHLSRFILIGIYSGTRAGAIASASPMPAVGRSYVDLERGRYYRQKQGVAKTNKRQPTVPIPSRLLAHLRRWHRIDPEAKHFVEFNGKPVASVKTAFKSAVKLAKLGPGISPHTLRHTAATWLMQRGADPWQAAGYLGMSLEVLLNTYGHHHPDYLSDAVEKIAKRDSAPRQAVTAAGTVIALQRPKSE